MKRLSLISLFLFSLLQLPIAGAAPGDLDVSFSGDGILAQDLGTDYDLASSVAVQADGKIVVAGSTGESPNGDFLVVRYLEDGSLDPDFGSGGLVTVDFSGGNDNATSLALQPDGRILMGGFVESAPGQFDFGLVRLDQDGALDSDFGTDGRVVTDFGRAFDVPNALALQNDGKIVLAGRTSATTALIDRDIAMARYESDGDLDVTFDEDGKLETSLDGLGATAVGLALDGEGKIVASGSSTMADSTSDPLLIRYLSDGRLDSSFDGDGLVQAGLGSAAANFGQVAVQPDGRIIAAGRLNQTVTGNDFLISRFEGDGSPDDSFGEGGRIVIDFEDLKGSDAARCLVLQADGKILVGGETTLGAASTHFALVRLNADGGLDAGFGGDGIVTTPLSVTGGQLSDLALASDGRLVAAGSASEGAIFDIAIARYLGDAADVSLSFMETTLSAVVGDTATFTVVVSNHGPDAAGGVVLTADIPPELELEGDSVTTTHGSCFVASDLVCEIGTLPIGESAQVTYRAIAKTVGGASSGFKLTAQARDESSGNNVSSLVTVIAEAAEDESGGGCSLHRHR